MSVERSSLLDRGVFPDGPEHALLRRFLLAQDGSTTRVCEHVAGRAVDVVLHRQARTEAVPQSVRRELGGARWLERVTSLAAGGRVLMDNLSYTRLDAVPDWFLAALDEGRAPIGHLLDRLFVKREPLSVDPVVAARLWEAVGAPDAQASRAYRIVTPQGPLMLIFEAFRAGLTTLA